MSSAAEPDSALSTRSGLRPLLTRPAHPTDPADQLKYRDLLLQQLAGHDDALDLVGALVDLCDLGLTGRWGR